MIIQCPDCQTRFQLDAERVPRRAIRVRCSKCRYVFGVDGAVLDTAPAEDNSPATPMPEPTADSSGSFDARSGVVESTVEATPASSGGFGLELERSELSSVSQDPEPVPQIEIDAPAATATMEPEADEVASEPTEVVEESPAAPAADVDPKQKKARRLARALVSDILVYNRETRDRALADGTLVQALGQEIKKSWELYKEKVDPDFASDSNLFRDALNDILADGQKIF